MSIQNLSISDGPAYTSEGETLGLKVFEREDSLGARDIRLVWSTELGSDTSVSWTIGVSAQGYARGKYAEEQICSDNETFAASECHESKPYGDGGRVWWSHNLNIGSALSKMTGGSRLWSYSGRAYDSIRIDVYVYSTFVSALPDGRTQSETARLTTFIGFIPIYTITGAYYEDKDRLTITYSTTWERKDDRWWICDDDSRVGGRSTVGGMTLTKSSTNGDITAIGRIDVPSERLSTFVAGKSVRLNVHFNASYRAIGDFFANSVKTLLVENRTTCDGVSLVLVSVGQTVKVRATAPTSDTMPDGAIIMVDGSHYNFDIMQVALGEIAEFKYLPFGSEVKLSAIGYRDNGSTSEATSSLTVKTPSGGGCVIDVLSTGERLVMTMTEGGADKGPTVKTSPESTAVKLAGRPRPSAFYGTGGETTVSFTGVVLDEYALDYEALAEKGDILMRFPDGRRYAITPTIDVARKNLYAVRVKISGSEVSA